MERRPSHCTSGIIVKSKDGGEGHLVRTMAEAVAALTASEDDDEIIRSLVIATTPAIHSSLDLSSITKLDLSGRNLSSLPDGLALHLPNLSILFCSDNRFTELPAAIGRCEHLQMVAFCGNGMTSIHPDALRPQLRWLILTDNCITALPNTIGQCGKLQKLMLSGNRLSTLPSSMENCTALELVRLASNRLIEPPWCLLKLPKLAWIGLSDNPFLPSLHDNNDNDDDHMAELPKFTDWDITTDEEYATVLANSPILGQGAGGITRKVTCYRNSIDVVDNVVAVKCAPPTIVSSAGSNGRMMTSDGSPQMERRINALVAQELSHIPSLVKILGQAYTGGDLVLEYLDNHRALAGPPSMESCSRDVYDADALSSDNDTALSVVRMVTQLLDALVALHDVTSVCHGDFYAHNILVRRSGSSQHPARLTDFGAAFCYDRTASYGPYLQAVELRAFAIFVQECVAQHSGNNAAFRIDDDQQRHVLEKLVDQCLAPDATMANVQIWWKQQLLKDISKAFDDTLESGVKEQ